MIFELNVMHPSIVNPALLWFCVNSGSSKKENLSALFISS